jgi:hypothetical protein
MIFLIEGSAAIDELKRRGLRFEASWKDGMIPPSNINDGVLLQAGTRQEKVLLTFCPMF